jgi:transcriptional regulator with XRE-family HTH domain
MMNSMNLARPVGRTDRRDKTRPVSRPVGQARYRVTTPAAEAVAAISEGRPPMLLREVIGDVLRELRQRQGRTLREVSSGARVSLGYLSEVERGQKEASSELLASISEALNTPLSYVMRVVAGRLAADEPLRVPDVADVVPETVPVPDTVPPELLHEQLAPAGG